MKHLLYLSTALILCCGMISCDKDRNYTIIEGTILEYGSLDPVENAAIEIFQAYSKGLFQGFVQWPIDTVYTNSDGSFKFKTDIDPHNNEYDTPGSFGISQISRENYFSENSIYGEIVEIFHLDKVKEEIQLDPYSWLLVTMEDVPEIESDYCKVFFEKDTDVHMIYSGIDTIIFSKRGNRNTYLHFKQFDEVLSTVDSFFMPAFDTLDYHIQF